MRLARLRVLLQADTAAATYLQTRRCSSLLASAAAARSPPTAGGICRAPTFLRPGSPRSAAFFATVAQTTLPPSSPSVGSLVFRLRQKLDARADGEAWHTFKAIHSSLYSPAPDHQQNSPTPIAAEDLDRLIDIIVRAKPRSALRQSRHVALEQVFSHYNTKRVADRAAGASKPLATSFALHNVLRSRAESAGASSPSGLDDAMELVKIAGRLGVPMDEGSIAVAFLRAFAASPLPAPLDSGTGSAVEDRRKEILSLLDAHISWVRGGKQTGLDWLRQQFKANGRFGASKFPPPLEPTLFSPKELRRPPPLPADAPVALRRRRKAWSRALRSMRAGEFPGASNEIRAACVAVLEGLGKAQTVDLDGMREVVRLIESATAGDGTVEVSAYLTLMKAAAETGDVAAVKAVRQDMQPKMQQWYAAKAAKKAKRAAAAEGKPSSSPVKKDAAAAAADAASAAGVNPLQPFAQLILIEMSASLAANDLAAARACLDDLKGALAAPTAESLQLMIRMHALAGHTESREAFAAAASLVGLLKTEMAAFAALLDSSATDLATAAAAAVAGASADGTAPSDLTETEMHLRAWDALWADAGVEPTVRTTALAFAGFVGTGKVELALAFKDRLDAEAAEMVAQQGGTGSAKAVRERGYEAAVLKAARAGRWDAAAFLVAQMAEAGVLAHLTAQEQAERLMELADGLVGVAAKATKAAGSENAEAEAETAALKEVFKALQALAAPAGSAGRIVGPVRVKLLGNSVVSCFGKDHPVVGTFHESITGGEGIRL
ncbi:hypothetical protein DFJ73DRAFT_807151 [Zopfochytrium polystomum]|nr:hypothetical protein DFJ73DRAFT_807151 [Zopfochytrium polystomum]